MSEIYKGVAFPFSFNSRGGVTTSILSPSDYTRIKDSITHIITTRRGEVPMKPLFGTNADNYIFEDFEDDTTIGMLQYEIEESLELLEPRVSVASMEVSRDASSERITFEVEVQIIKFNVTEKIIVEVEQ